MENRRWRDFTLTRSGLEFRAVEMIEGLSINCGWAACYRFSTCFGHGTGCLLVCFQVSSLIFHAFTRSSTPKGTEQERYTKARGKGSGSVVHVSRQSGSFRPLFQPASFLPAGQGETKDKLQRRPSCDPSHLSIGNWPGQRAEPDTKNSKQDHFLHSYSSLVFIYFLVLRNNKFPSMTSFQFFAFTTANVFDRINKWRMALGALSALPRFFERCRSVFGMQMCRFLICIWLLYFLFCLPLCLIASLNRRTVLLSLNSFSSQVLFAASDKSSNDDSL